MSIVSESLQSSAGEVAPVSANHAMAGLYSNTLLSFRDDALLLAYRMSGNITDAEDILQNAYLKAVRLPEPRRAGPELRAWFLKLTANIARDWHRSEHRRREREKNAAADAPIAAPEAAADCEHSELKRQVNAEIAKLDEKFRAPICLHYEQGLTYEEASEILGVPAGSLRANASRGVQLLRERLERPERLMPLQLLSALLATGTALKVTPALAASIEQAVTSAGSATAATGASAGNAAGAAHAYLPQAAAGLKAGILTKGLVVATVLLSATTAALGYLLYLKVQAMNTVASPQSLIVEDVKTNETEVVVTPEPLEQVRPQQQPALVAKNETPAVSAPPATFPKTPAAVQALGYAPPPEVEAQWENAVDLVQLIQHFNPNREVVSGKWSVKDKELRQAPGEFSRIAFNYIPPEEYDFRIDFTRSGQGTELIQMVPLDGATAAWHIDAWNAHYWGPLQGNHLAVPAPNPFANSVRHTSIVEVRKDALTTWLDGQMILRLPRKGVPSTDAEYYWRVPDSRLVGIGGKQTATVFHRVAIREVTGRGKPASEDPFRAALDEAYWANARNLMPAKPAPTSRIAGKWAGIDGALVGSGKYARYQFDYAPPLEYDMRIVFTRELGRKEIVQILSAQDKEFVWKIDAAGVTSLDRIKGASKIANPMSLSTPNLIQPATQHISVVCVRKDEVRAYVDERLMLAWKTNFADLSIEEEWKLPVARALGIGTCDSTVTFSKVEVKEVSGAGEELRPATGTPAPVTPPMHNKAP